MKMTKDFYGYEVNSNGEIISKRFNRPLKQTIHSNGYVGVTLYINDKPIQYTIHRLIAELFIPNPDNKPCVDHINGDKTNNNVSNLRWTTYEENNNNEITKQRQRNSTKNKSVNQYTLDGIFIQTFKSIKEAEIITGCDHSRISACCNGKRKKTGGFKWTYKKESD